MLVAVRCSTGVYPWRTCLGLNMIVHLSDPDLQHSLAILINSFWNFLTVSQCTICRGRKLYTRTKPKSEFLVISRNLPLQRSSIWRSWRLSEYLVPDGSTLAGGNKDISQGWARPSWHLCKRVFRCPFGDLEGPDCNPRKQWQDPFSSLRESGP